MPRYTDARANDMRRKVELGRSTAWEQGSSEGPLNLPYCPTSPDVEGCRCVVSCDDDLFNSDS